LKDNKNITSCCCSATSGWGAAGATSSSVGSLGIGNDKVASLVPIGTENGSYSKKDDKIFRMAYLKIKNFK